MASRIDRLLKLQAEELARLEDREVREFLRAYEEARGLLRDRLDLLKTQGLTGNWTAQHTRAALIQIDAGITNLERRLDIVLTAQVRKRRTTALKHMLAVFRRMEPDFKDTGVGLEVAVIRRFAELDGLLLHRNSLKRYGADLIRDIQRELILGQTAKLSTDEMIRRVAATDGIFKKHRGRAGLIVRMETASAYDSAHQAGLEEAVAVLDADEPDRPDPLMKRADEFFDSRNHPFSRALHGRLAPVDGEWEVPAAEVQAWAAALEKGIGGVLWPLDGGTYHGGSYPAHFGDRGRKIPWRTSWGTIEREAPPPIEPKKKPKAKPAPAAKPPAKKAKRPPAQRPRWTHLDTGTAPKLEPVNDTDSGVLQNLRSQGPLTRAELRERNIPAASRKRLLDGGWLVKRGDRFVPAGWNDPGDGTVFGFGASGGVKGDKLPPEFLRRVDDKVPLAAMKTAREGLGRVPGAIISTASRRGTKGLIADRVPDAFPELREKTPTGWPSGTWENAGGAYNPLRKQFVVATASETRFRRPLLNSVLHEFGHAVDHLERGPTGFQVLSDSTWFRDLAKELAETPFLYPSGNPAGHSLLQELLNRTTGRNEGYYVNPKTGRKELFAELCSIAWVSPRYRVVIEELRPGLLRLMSEGIESAL